MDIAKAYKNQINQEEYEHQQRMIEYESRHKIEKANRPDFSRYCHRITLYRAARLLNKIYEARVAAGKAPFTHAYDYPLRKQCWLAKNDFHICGRYGAESNDMVFVPQGITITGWDHTTVLYVDEWEENDFVPAYSNTV